MGERLFKALLLLYPRSFRFRYGEEQVEFYRQERWALGIRPGTRRLLGFWMGTLRDILASAARLRAQSLVSGGQRTHRKGAEMKRDFSQSKRRGAGDVLQDIRFAWKTFRRRPVFGLLVVGTLGLGFGGTTALFSVVNSILLRPLPYPDSEGLAYVGSVWGNTRPSGMTPPEFLALHRSTRTFAALAASRYTTLDVIGGEEPERLSVSAVTADYFRVVGVQPALGRGFVESDFNAGFNQRIVILSYETWQRRWGGDPTVIGSTFRASEQRSEGMFTFTVVGVMPTGFRHPWSMEDPYSGFHNTQVWTPLPLEGTPEGELWTAYRLRVVGRLRSDRSTEDARAEAESLVAVLATQHPEFYTGKYRAGRNLGVAPLLEQTVGNRRSDLLLLFGGAGLLLLIAVANAVSLFLARALERNRESAIRIALGAGSLRIAQHFMVESTLLALLGSIIGLGIAGIAVRALPALLPGDFPRIDTITVDLRVTLLTGSVAVLIGVLIGLVPGLLYTHRSAGLSLGSRGTERRATARLRTGLVTTEIALALTLLTGAGLLVNSYYRLQHVDPGFDPEDRLLMPIRLPLAYDTDASRLSFFDELHGCLQSIPGVRSVSWIEDPPMGYGNWHPYIIIEGADPNAEPPIILSHRVGPNFLHAMGIPLLSGRDFGQVDNTSGRRVAIVDQVMAERFWPGLNPIGRKLRTANEPEDQWATVIGLAGAILQESLAERPEPHVYFPYLQNAVDRGTVVVLYADLELQGIAPQLRAAVWDLDPNLPVPGFEKMEDRIGDVLSFRRFRTLLMGIFALSALILSLAGIYALMLYLVTGQYREIGIRMALGADNRRVLWTVSQRGLVLVGVGTVIGLTMAGVASGLLTGLLFEISRFDLPTYLTVALVFDAAALLGCLIPAFRAIRLDPTVVLRVD